MQDGFVKVAAVTPEVRVADVAFNVDACVRAAQTACTVHGAMVVTLPELCLTAYTCEDLFWQDALLSAADKGLADFAQRIYGYVEKAYVPRAEARRMEERIRPFVKGERE